MTTSDRKPTTLEQWLLQRLKEVGEDGAQRPVLPCQVTWVTGEKASGGVRASEIPGVFEMLVEMQRATGERVAVDRIFPAETMLLIELPRDLPPIERTASGSGGSRLWTPGG
jgi:hypothetical protein